MGLLEDLERYHSLYATVPTLDLLFYEMKGKGITYVDAHGRRPKVHLHDGRSLFSFVPLMPTPSSPYELDAELRRKGETLPCTVKVFPRIQGTLGYFYLRDPQEWIQTLDQEVVLNTNFNPHCIGCQFCSRGYDRYASLDLPGLSAQQGLDLVLSQGVILSELAEIAVVTGTFEDGSVAVQHILDIARLAKKRGFHGRIFYLGCQVDSQVLVRRLLTGLEGIPFRYAYTAETFQRRELMHHTKTHSMEDCAAILQELRRTGISSLEYTYMPGLDNLSWFARWAPVLSPIARPHISIFRPATEAHSRLMTEMFVETPVDYLCTMRLILEHLYGGPVHGNNLGNLWPFPLSRIHPRFATGEVPHG